MSNTLPIEALVKDFIVRLEAAVRAEASEQVSAVVGAALSRTPAPRKAAAGKPAGSPGRRQLRLSPAGMAARKLQGKYLGALRALSGSARLRVKKVAQNEGVAAALKLAAKLK